MIVRRKSRGFLSRRTNAALLRDPAFLISRFPRLPHLPARVPASAFRDAVEVLVSAQEKILPEDHR